MPCTVYELHEFLITCAHREPVMVAVRLDDGCSGRLCPECDKALGMRHWPGVAERLAGPVTGLDALDLMRAVLQSART
jgi:hypothetical protein